MQGGVENWEPGQHRRQHRWLSLCWWESHHDISMWNAHYLYFTDTETDDLILVILYLSLLFSAPQLIIYKILIMEQMISNFSSLLWSLLNIGAISVQFTRDASEVERSLPLMDSQHWAVIVAGEFSELHVRLICWHLAEASKPAKALNYKGWVLRAHCYDT